MGTVGPGEQQVEEPLELLYVDAVLLQVREAGVVALCWVTAAAPVAAGQVLRLEGRNVYIFFIRERRQRGWSPNKANPKPTCYVLEH